MFMNRLFLIATLSVALLNGCSKSTEERHPVGGYSFEDIYLYSNGSLVDMQNLKIFVPAEEGVTDLEVVSYGLTRFQCLEENENITLEKSFSVPPEEKDVYEKVEGYHVRYKQTLRIRHRYNPYKSRQCSYRIFSAGFDGLAADITIVQRSARDCLMCFLVCPPQDCPRRVLSIFRCKQIIQDDKALDNVAVGVFLQTFRGD